MTFSTLRAKGGESPRRIYLDHHATTPIAAEVAEHLPEWLEAWGNPSSIHWSGRRPKQLLREARMSFASMIGADPLEIAFVAGGSEANNWAIKSGFEAARAKDPSRTTVVVTAVEHPSVKRAAESLRGRGAQVIEIAVDREGRVDMDALDRALAGGRAALASVMLANNETGHVYPVAEIAARARASGALVHADCVQGLGKIPIDIKNLGIDMASFAGHKFYSLKGAGALWMRRGLSLEPLIHGGNQERRRRGGTENLLAIASLGLVCRRSGEVAERGARMAELRDRMEERILREIPGVAIAGRQATRLPSGSSMTITGVDGETLLMNLDILGFAVSTGAACSSGSPEPSPTLLAMGLSRSEAQSSLRVGLGWGTGADEVDSFVDALAASVARIRSFSGASSSPRASASAKASAQEGPSHGAVV